MIWAEKQRFSYRTVYTRKIHIRFTATITDTGKFSIYYHGMRKKSGVLHKLSFLLIILLLKMDKKDPLHRGSGSNTIRYIKSNNLHKTVEKESTLCYFDLGCVNFTGLLAI